MKKRRRNILGYLRIRKIIPGGLPKPDSAESGHGFLHGLKRSRSINLHSRILLLFHRTRFSKTHSLDRFRTRNRAVFHTPRFGSVQFNASNLRKFTETQKEREENVSEFEGFEKTKTKI